MLQGCTLLVDAVGRGDGFTAQFLLDHDCDVNLTARSTADTALHIVCTYSEKASEIDGDTAKEMVLVGKALLSKQADPNLQNNRG